MKIDKIIILAALMLASSSPLVSASCDTMSGPVIKAARQALEAKNVELALIWVEKKDEETIRKAFKEALESRKSQPQNRQSDLPFYEALMRSYCQSAGEEYAGLKFNEILVNPGIMAADEVLESGSVEKLVSESLRAVNTGIRERSNRLMEKSRRRNESLAAGREYVQAYAEFVHYLESLFEDIAGEGIQPTEKFQAELSDREQ